MNGIWLRGSLPTERQETCIKCDKLATQICRYCGTLCRNHGVIHRHEEGSNDHATEEIGHDIVNWWTS